jgi:hypothetical protein
MSHLQVQIAKVAIEKMLAGGHFSISTLHAVGDMLGVNPRQTLAYRMLAPLHCVDYVDMPSDVREAIPGLIRDAFDGEQFGGALRTARIGRRYD